MSQTISSEDIFLDMDEVAESDPMAGDEPSTSRRKSSNSVASRNRLEAMIADRQLEKDIQEYNFDF